MARSAKKSGRKSVKKMPLDWVVNDYTYSSIFQTVGNDNIAGFPLTFPKFIQEELTFPGGVSLGGYAYPEQSRGQVAVAVVGDIVMVPTTWAIGSFYDLMFRIVKKPMDYTGGLGAIVDPAYTLYQAQFANEQFQWQRHVHNEFQLGTAHEMLTVKWSGRVNIAPDEALYIFAENQTGITANVRINFHLRTLMRADE